MSEPILSIRGLDVRFATPDGEVHAVRGVDLDVAAGETLAVVGESGSGKSQVMMAAMGLLAANGTATGSVRYRAVEVLGMAPRRLNRIRGRKITMIFQEPMTSLDPLYPVGRQIGELLACHGGLRGRKARERTLELLRLVRIRDPEHRIDAYPHQLSGGQRQRVMVAMALANGPDLLIADEPTTALDVTVQAQILELLAELQERFGMAIILISHDLGVVRHIADRVAVMQDGHVVETGPVETIFAAPREDYTRKLLAAEPEGRKTPVADTARRLLSVDDVRVTFRIARGLLGRHSYDVRAVRGVSLEVRSGQTVGIVGESGSGKSTLGRAILRLVPADGRIVFEGRPLHNLDEPAIRPLRRQMQMVFQDPFGSLSPRLTVGEIVTEGLLVHEPSLSRADRDRRAAELLRSVGLEPAVRNRYPHEFSGGQRQRIAVARALALNPRFIVLDEPTSALDRTVQKQIIDLMRRLQVEFGLTYVFISHDLAVVRAMADTVLVMKDGEIVESGPAEAIFARPKTDYTRELIGAAFGDRLVAAGVGC